MSDLPPADTATPAVDLQEIAAAITTIMRRLEQQDAAMQVLASRVPALPAPVAPPAPEPDLPALARSEPQLAMPNKFTGDSKDVRPFLHQLETIFQQHAHRYPTDRTKVAMLHSLLAGAALRWATALIEKKDVRVQSMDQFAAALVHTFGDPVLALTAAHKLRALRQGKGSVADYITEFLVISPDTGWDDVALHAQFLNNLSPVVKTQMLSMPIPVDLNDAMSSAKLAAARLEQHHEELRHVDVPRRVVPAAPAQGVKPMEIGGVQGRTDREAVQQYRLAHGLCLYCGAPEHRIRDCPKKPQGKGQAQSP